MADRHVTNHPTRVWLIRAEIGARSRASNSSGRRPSRASCGLGGHLRGWTNSPPGTPTHAQSFRWLPAARKPTSTHFRIVGRSVASHTITTDIIGVRVRVRVRIWLYLFCGWSQHESGVQISATLISLRAHRCPGLLRALRAGDTSTPSPHPIRLRLSTTPGPGPLHCRAGFAVPAALRRLR